MHLPVSDSLYGFKVKTPYADFPPMWYKGKPKDSRVSPRFKLPADTY